MAAELPIWFGQERGTNLADLVVLEDVDGREEGGDGVLAAALGLIVPPLIIALILGFGQLPMAPMVPLALAGAAWLATGLASAWFVAFPDGDLEPPTWAQAVAAILTGLGHVMLITAVIAAMLAAMTVVLGVIVGIAAAASGDR